MTKRTEIACDNRIAVDINGLQAMLSVGRNTAINIAKEAGAAFNIGSRKLYNVRKIEVYIDSLQEG